MEENEYKDAYNQITQVVCVFEKALTNNLCKCSYAKHFCLADREGYACKSKQASDKCAELMQHLRENARFSLKLHSIGSQLPHNMEIRVQAGGLTGLQKLYGEADPCYISGNIRELVECAVTQVGNLDALPYNEIIKSIAEYKVRSRRKSNK